MHNGNVDESSLVVLHHCGYLRLEDMDNELAARSNPGRPKKSKHGKEKGKNCLQKYREVLNTNKGIRYYGHQVVIDHDNMSTVGIIRATKYNKGGEKYMYHIFFEHNTPDSTHMWADTETTSLGMFEAVENGLGGPSHLHNKCQSRESEINDALKQS